VGCRPLAIALVAGCSFVHGGGETSGPADGSTTMGPDARRTDAPRPIDGPPDAALTGSLSVTVANMGARDIDLTVSVELNPGRDGAVTKAIVDPFVGVEYSHPLGEHWNVVARADYGGFNLESKSQKHVLATFSYRFNDRLTAFGGYRYLKVDFESTREVLRLTAAGPAFGFSWSW